MKILHKAYFTVPLLTKPHTLQPQLKHSINYMQTNIIIIIILLITEVNLPIVMLVLTYTLGSFSIFTAHVYFPESANSTESRVYDDEYRVKEIISGLVVDTIIVPSGPVHSMLTARGILTIDFISTVQVKVGEDPDSMGLGESE